MSRRTLTIELTPEIEAAAVAPILAKGVPPGERERRGRILDEMRAMYPDLHRLSYGQRGEGGDVRGHRGLILVQFALPALILECARPCSRFCPDDPVAAARRISHLCGTEPGATRDRVSLVKARTGSAHSRVDRLSF